MKIISKCFLYEVFPWEFLLPENFPPSVIIGQQNGITNVQKNRTREAMLRGLGMEGGGKLEERSSESKRGVEISPIHHHPHHD